MARKSSRHSAEPAIPVRRGSATPGRVRLPVRPQPASLLPCRGRGSRGWSVSSYRSVRRARGTIARITSLSRASAQRVVRESPHPVCGTCSYTGASHRAPRDPGGARHRASRVSRTARCGERSSLGAPTRMSKPCSYGKDLVASLAGMLASSVAMSPGFKRGDRFTPGRN